MNGTIRVTENNMIYLLLVSILGMIAVILTYGVLGPGFAIFLNDRGIAYNTRCVK